MNLMLIMSLRWTRSCPRTGGVLKASASIASPKLLVKTLHHLRFWACSLNLGNRKNECIIVIFGTSTQLSDLRI